MVQNKLVMLTAYDFETANLLEQAGVDFILVGDSYGMVVLGESDTRSVTLDMLIPVAKEVRRGASHSFIAFDMPYKTFETKEEALINVQRVLVETGCDAVKIEGRADVAMFLVKNNIKVLGHTGLKPQFVESYGVKGRNEEEAAQIIQEAKDLEKAGAFALVLECIPEALAKKITDNLKIPTIGIGAGRFCKGEVRVTHDILGWNGGKDYSFVEKFDDKNKSDLENLQDFVKFVREARFD